MSGGDCGNCGGCGGCGGGPLLLTEAELALLRRFGETPFLPAAAGLDRETPVYLEDRDRPGAVQRRHPGPGGEGPDPGGL